MAAPSVTSVPSAISDAAARYARRLERRFGARLRWARLFGSFARGQGRDDSDIDVAVVVDGLSPEERSFCFHAAVDVEDELEGVLFGPFVCSGDQWDLLVARERRIAHEILRDGIAL